MTRRAAHIDAMAQAVAYLQAGGRPEAVPHHIRASAWRRAGRMTYADGGGRWLYPHTAGDGQQVAEVTAGVPTALRGRTTIMQLHPVAEHTGATDGPRHTLPNGGRESVFVLTDGSVRRGLYWSGNYADMARETGSRVAERVARAQAGQVAG